MKNKTKRDMMTIQYKPRVDSFSCNGKTEYWPIIEIYRDNKLIDCIEDQSAGFTSYHAALELAKEEISQRLDAKKDVKIKTRLEIEKKEYFDFDFQRGNSPQDQELEDLFTEKVNSTFSATELKKIRAEESELEHFQGLFADCVRELGYKSHPDDYSYYLF